MISIRISFPKEIRFIAIVFSFFFVTGCNAMKSVQPEDFFHGSQLLLAQSISGGEVEEVKELSRKTKLNVPGEQDMTILFFALQTAYGEKSNQLRIMAELVRSGADPIQQVPDMGSVAEVVAKAKSPLYMEALLDGGMSPNAEVEDTPLIFDTATDHTIDTLKLMVSRGAEIDKKDSLGKTALMNSLDGMQLDSVTWLIQHGANPNEVESNTGWSFSRQLEYVISRESSSDKRTTEKLDEIKRLAIGKGMKWPPVSH